MPLLGRAQWVGKGLRDTDNDDCCAGTTVIAATLLWNTWGLEHPSAGNWTCWALGAGTLLLDTGVLLHAAGGWNNAG